MYYKELIIFKVLAN